MKEKLMNWIKQNKKITIGSGIVLLIVIAAFALKPGGGKGGPPGGEAGGFAMRVVVEPTAQETIEEAIPLVGTLAANESVEIQSETEGKIETINFREGQTVHKGRVLFLIDQTKLSAQVQQAEANFRLSQSNIKRSESLVENGTISQQEYDQSLSRYELDKAALELARQQLQDATITAPFSGTMGARFVSPGQVVAKGTLLSTIIDGDPMKVEFNVPERYAGRLKTKLPVDIKVESYPEGVFQGNVYFTSPFVDVETRTVLAKARIPNEEGLLQPGMFANLDLRLGVVENAITIPESALMKQGDRVQVFVATEENTAELRVVKAGLRLKGRVQILEGIQPNELVVTEGIQKIRPGAPISFDAPVSTEAAKTSAAPEVSSSVEKKPTATIN